MAVIIALLSGSGGTGKTTLLACMGGALAREGKRALVIDLCAGARGLDLPLGLESRAAFDLGDLLSGGCDEGQAVISDSARPCPDFIAAPLDRDSIGIDAAALSELLEKLRPKYDWIALDAPSGVGAGSMLAALVADRVIVVTIPENASVRAAERALEAVRSPDRPEPLVIINKLNPSFAASGAHLTPDAVAQTLDAKLIGVVLYDETLARAAALGRVLGPYERSPGFRTAETIADRTLGAASPKRWIVNRRALFASGAIKEEW
jgi:septum site-determining protein MinD